MKSRLLLIALLASLTSFGQGWEQTYEFTDLFIPTGRSVQQTSDGGYIIACDSYDDSESYKILLIKTDNNGTQQFAQTYNAWDENANINGAYAIIDQTRISVKQTIDGGYVIVGSIIVSDDDGGWGSSDVYLIKTNANGEEQWNRTFGGNGVDAGCDVSQTSDGGYIITGSYSYVLSSGYLPEQEIYLIKTDSNGMEQWSQTFGGSENGWQINTGRSVQQTSDGGYIITGNIAGEGGSLIKTGENGVVEWSQSYGSINPRYGQPTNEGGYMIFGRSGISMYIIKADELGNEQWSQNVFGSPNAFSAKQTSDNGYILTAGDDLNGDNYGDLILVKTDNDGEVQWVQNFLPSLWVEIIGYDVSQTSDGGYIITGRSAGEESGVYLIKTDSEGTLSSSFTIPTPSSRKLEKVVDALGREVNHTTNQILFYIYDDGSVEKKFVLE